MTTDFSRKLIKGRIVEIWSKSKDIEKVWNECEEFYNRTDNN